MDGKRWILFLLLVLGVGSIYGQSFQYQYTDPCTGVLNTITISQPNGSVTLFYAGQWNTFTQQQLLGGAYETWVAQINSQFPIGSNPCAGNGSQNTTTTNTATATTLVNNISGIVGIAASIGSQAASSVNVPPPTENGNTSSDAGGEQNTTTEPNIESGSSSNNGGGNDQNITTASGGESESSSDGGGGGGGNKPKSKQEKISRGALIGSGDFVAIRNGNDITKSGGDNFRFNTSLTHVNTKQNFIKGINLNYTTGENVLNTTLYGSYKTKKFMGVFSNSVMTNFKSDVFNTTTLLTAQKLGIMTGMLGTNLTLGKIGKSNFGNWSVVGGGFTGFNGGKLLSLNLMVLGVYSPYVFYYQGQWYDTGLLLVPLGNIDFKLTDKFKWSISISGAYQLNVDILNYQISTGTKMLL